ncbi:hypothetical protein EfmGK941_30520 (plasmid) [Enterococcus faecium]|nr:hypothetical protein EfmGK923_30280 [Enterococcus faecium]BDP96047.1 hypothetical protein EfmGK941_30520 [Enterococcus faecium]
MIKSSGYGNGKSLARDTLVIPKAFLANGLDAKIRPLPRSPFISAGLLITTSLVLSG